METEELVNSLVLIYSRKTDEPIGTGFFVSEEGNFVTAFHTIFTRLDMKEHLFCRWKELSLPIEPIGLLRQFYYAAEDCSQRIRMDLTVLRARLTNVRVPVRPLPVTLFDLNEKLPACLPVQSRGFRVEGVKHWQDAPLLPCESHLAAYHPENGTWLTTETDVFTGFSGSPVVNPLTRAVTWVIVRRYEGKPVIQSLHMLADALERTAPSWRRLFTLRSPLYDEYHARKSALLRLEKWPYDIDRKTFVDAFQFTTYRFLSDIETTPEVPNDDRCVPFAIRQLKDRPLLCIGYYGMGKTTISKHLFTNYSEYSHDAYPIFIRLAGRRLSEWDADTLNNRILGEICADMNNKQLDKSKYPRQDVSWIREYFRGLLEHETIVLIFDGIDEASSNQTSLSQFTELLLSVEWPFFLTSRKEFHAFLNIFRRIMGGTDHLALDLADWGEIQWGQYVDGLLQKFPEKADSIERLRRGLADQSYGDLPKRPLFLRMISDLELGSEVYSRKIPDELRSNRAEMYHYYIRWKIRDDYWRKRGLRHVRNAPLFTKESFQLFRRLASVEYEQSNPQNIALGPSDTVKESDDQYTYSGFTAKDVQGVCRGFTALRPGLILEHMATSPFFSMIRREVEDEEEERELYRFSHKSFCEYLFAYNLAHSIFQGQVKQAECGDEWNLYQTFEVSAFFQEEVERRRIRKSLSEEDRNLYLQSAFEKVLATQGESTTYAKRVEEVEEVLYYTGRFKIRSPRILAVLKKIAEDPLWVDPVYYRTAHLALGFAEVPDYCMKYVEYLIDSYRNDRAAFQLNSDIQTDYYGRANLHSALKTAIDKYMKAFVKDDQLEGILPLRIFSYFTCVPFGPAEIAPTREYLHEIRAVFADKGKARMTAIVDSTEAVFLDVSKPARR